MKRKLSCLLLAIVSPFLLIFLVPIAIIMGTGFLHQLDRGECAAAVQTFNSGVNLRRSFTLTSPDNQFLVLPDSTPSNSDGTDMLRFCDVQSSRQITTLDAGLPWTFSHDSTILVTSGFSWCGLKLWDGVTGAPIATLQPCTDRWLQVSSAAFNSDNTLLAVGIYNYRTRDVTLQVWNMQTRELISTMIGQPSRIDSIAFSEDSRVIATTSMDGTIWLWDNGF